MIPIGSPYALQRLVLVEKTAGGERRDRVLSGVRFVPLTRDVTENVEAGVSKKP